MPPAEAKIRSARTRADYDACVSLQREVWGMSDLDITSALQLIATVHAGGLLLVAEAEGEVVGFSYGFVGLRDGAPHLHSDMLAVRPAWRGHKLGLQLKWAQRDAALARGFELVTWTFDPMRARNARLNLHHLGARVAEYLPDLYGRTSSALHQGLATDRLVAEWPIGSARVARLAARRVTPLRQSHAARLNEVRLEGGLPVSSEPRPVPAAARLELLVPSDWDAVCAAGAGLAQEWQGIARRAFTAAFARGYAAVDTVAVPGAPVVAYVLERVTPRPSLPAASGRKTTRSTTRRTAGRAAPRRAARAGRGRR
jgi:predicted GNAT superfamily acetyltransferase